jgi:hypothetical protein
MLNGGVVDGKRLISEAAFAELIKPQMKLTAELIMASGGIYVIGAD